ncbi:hypothetical protein LOAG_11564 [Loa loa]|uniref:Uncharacterized protein n=1 Tax=Loa loa TaxID=7209 RepID=A0A1S0TMW8_LOALO|nr:hypothetical protein LOAG_11564 [Loa loa]EFO16940.1 hypothetical protein LOAG_11564 [Loa loa]
MTSQRLSYQKEKLMSSDLLRIINQNSMLRASLILLTIVMTFFTVIKIGKLLYQIRYCHHQEEEVNESDSEIPEVLIKSHSADYPSFVDKKGIKKKDGSTRTSRTWKVKSNSNSNSLPKHNTMNKWDLKQVKCNKVPTNQQPNPEGTGLELKCFIRIAMMTNKTYTIQSFFIRSSVH